MRLPFLSCVLGALLAGGAGAARVAVAGPRLERALESSLGPLEGRLQAEGWIPAAALSGGPQLGDLRDPASNTLLVRGGDCFSTTAARRTAVRDTRLSRALTVEGGLPLAGLSARASAEGSVQVLLQEPVVSELPTAELRPSTGCRELLQTWTEDGRSLQHWTVVQSVLVADLRIEGCGALAIGLGGGMGASAAVSRCEASGGEGTVVAFREVALTDILEAAGLALLRAPPPPPRRRRRAKGPPCWVDRSCTPPEAAGRRWTVGTAADLAGADRAARAALLQRFQLRLGTVAPSDDARRQALEQELLRHIALPLRYRAPEGTHAALAVLDAAALGQALEARQTELLTVLRPASPELRAGREVLDQLALLRAAAAPAAELSLVSAALELLPGSPAPPPAWARPSALARAAQELRGSVALAISPGPLEAPLALAAGLAGFAVQEAPTEDGYLLQAQDVALQTAAAPGVVLGGGGPSILRCTGSGQVALLHGSRLVAQEPLSVQLGAPDPARCRAAAERAMADQALEASARLLSGEGSP